MTWRSLGLTRAINSACAVQKLNTSHATQECHSCYDIRSVQLKLLHASISTDIFNTFIDEVQHSHMQHGYMASCQPRLLLLMLP